MGPAAALHTSATGRRPPGANYRDGAAHFCVWAPEAERVELVVESDSRSYELTRDTEGYFHGTYSLAPGALYRYRVDDRGPYPDPCSRFQPHGTHGPSLLIAADDFPCTDSLWRGTSLRGQVIYELHIGTFTKEGTFDAALARLPYLRELGITVIELLPIVECAGRWNWGYDGAQFYAPAHVYGDYEALKRFVDAAHRQGLAVILDVVYNHLGPDGNYLTCFSPYYLSRAYRTEWGEALNYDGEHATPVRELIIDNACYWVEQFHVDGFRLDATQSIFDSSQPHVIAELVQRARAVAQPRELIVIAENEPQRSEHLEPLEHGGQGLDGMWNDDFHHCARVALTGSRDGYLFDYLGRSQEFVSCAKRGFLYQGQHHTRQRQPRGSLLRGQPAWSCVHFLQNHDQIANTYTGQRLITLCAPARLRAMTALLLLGPQTPLLFMGEEFGSRQPFTFFADHEPELALRVHEGRRDFLAQFTAYATPQARKQIPDPAASATFLACKLDWSNATEPNVWLNLYRDLLRLRREDPVLRLQGEHGLDGATLSESAFVLRWSSNGDERLLVLNLGTELPLAPASEPLLAPPRGRTWQLAWSSEDPAYGGSGAISPVDHDAPGWHLPANCAALLQPAALKLLALEEDR